MESWQTFPPLADEYPEQVFTHELPADRPVAVEVAAPSGLAVRIAFDTAQLPGLIQWRVAERGHYVLGIEPATAPTILGRADARARGLLRPLAPGEERMLGVEVAVTLP